VTHVVGVQVVGIGGVDQGHAGVEGGMDRGDRAVAVGTPLDGHRHAAEADRGDGAAADGAVLHELLLKCRNGFGTETRKR
jgi:hypothetical protein